MTIKFKIGVYENKLSFGKTLKTLDLTKIKDIELFMSKIKEQTLFMCSSIKNIKRIKEGEYSVEEITLIECEKL